MMFIQIENSFVKIKIIKWKYEHPKAKDVRKIQVGFKGIYIFVARKENESVRPKQDSEDLVEDKEIPRNNDNENEQGREKGELKYVQK